MCNNIAFGASLAIGFEQARLQHQVENLSGDLSRSFPLILRIPSQNQRKSVLSGEGAEVLYNNLGKIAQPGDGSSAAPGVCAI